MSNTIYKKDLHDVALAVAQGSKAYTDKKAEEILWHVGEYSVSTSDDNTTASTKTVPANATRCKIKRIYGLTQKFSPTIAYDDTSYSVKTMPATVYDFDVSKVEGKSYKGTILDGYTGSYSSSSTTMALNRGHLTRIVTSSSNLFVNMQLDNPITLKANTTYYYAGYNSTFTNRINFSSEEINDNSQALFGIPSATPTTLRTYTPTSDTVINYIAVYKSGAALNESIDIMISTEQFTDFFAGIHNLELSGLKVEGSNLANITEINYRLATNGTLTQSENGNTSDYIKVKEGETYSTNIVAYTTSNYLSIAYYDSNKTFVSGVLANQNVSNITIPSGVSYMRVSYRPSLVENLMVNRGSTVLDYVPYITPTTLPIDLSTILYNGSPLFEGNSLKAVNDVKDILTPYKATKKLGYVDLGSLNYTTGATTQNSNYRLITNDIADSIKKSTSTSEIPNIVCAKYEGKSLNGTYQEQVGISVNTDGKLIIYDSNYNQSTSASDFKTAMSGVYLVYELATPIEVSIDWSSTLRGITGYSNGTITLQNTYNMDTANTITYNSIIKENCCAKMVQSRGGSVIKTINFPTQASDGYSAGSASNVRDFTTNKRIGNVSKEDLGNPTWSAITINNKLRFDALISNKKSYSSDYATNILCKNYVASTAPIGNNDVNMAISGFANEKVYVRDDRYDNTTTFKTANVGNPLYYELADASKTETSIDSVDNIIEVQPNDVLTFYDSNDNEVTIPSDLTYRIEVAN